MPARCPTCDSVYEDPNTVCVLDGTTLIPEPTAAPSPAPTPTTSAGKSGSALVGVLAGTVVVLGAALAFFALRPSSASPGSAATFSAVTSATTQTPSRSDSDVDEPPPAPPPRDLVAVGTAPSAPRRSATSSGPARVNTGGAGLLLRDGPGRGYDAIGKMLPGDVVTVQGCDDAPPGRRWCRVVYGGVKGWTVDEFLDIGGPASDTDSGIEQAFARAEVIGRTGTVDGYEVSFVHLREQPFTGGDVLARMEPGETVHVLRCLPSGWSLGGRAITGRWCLVRAQTGGRAISGWASNGALIW